MVSIRNLAMVLLAAIVFTATAQSQTYSPTPLHTTSCCGLGITRVQLGSIDQSSLYNEGAGYYMYYSGQSTSLDAGQAYTLTVTRDYYTTNKLSVWIDWNDNGNFTDAGEQVYTGTNVPTVSAIPFTVPFTATAGTTRMRIRHTFTSTLTPTNAVSYGNTEDYNVVISVPEPELEVSAVESTYAGVGISGTSSVSSATPPYTFSVNNISNAAWVAIDSATGKLFGAPGASDGGTTASFEVVMVDAGMASDSVIVDIDVLSPLPIPYSDAMEGGQVANYIISTGAESDAAIHPSAGESGNGLLLSGSGDGATWPLSPGTDAANAAVLNSPNKWGGGASPDATPFNGRAEFYVSASVVTRLALSFDYRITNNSTDNDAEFFANFSIEYTENGNDWLRATGQTSTAQGFYRDENANFQRETTLLTLSGKQSQVGIRISWLVRNDWDGAQPTFVSIDNLSVFLPIQILTESALPAAQSTVPYGPIAIELFGGSAPSTLAFDPANPPAQGFNLSLVQDPQSGNWTLETPANLGPDVASAGLHSFNIVANDINNVPHSKPFTFSVAPAPAALEIENSVIPSTTEGAAYSYEIAVIGGVPRLGPNPYSFALINASAAWVAIDPDTGELNGNVPVGDLGIDHMLTVVVTDRIGVMTQKTFTLSVVDQLEISSTDLPAGEVASSYYFKLVAGGGQAPFTWEFVSGSKPVGVNLNPQTGELIGVPYLGQEGNHAFDVRVSDSGTQSVVQKVNVNIAVKSLGFLTVLSQTNEVGDLTAGQGKETFLKAAGGTPPYVWSMISSNLPTGMNLASNGLLTGTPVAGSEGTYVLKIRVLDSQGASSVQNFVVDISPEYFAPMIVTPQVFPEGTEGVNYLLLLEVDNGVPPYSWAITAGTLPAGINLNTSGGSLTGTPTSAANGDYNFDLEVTDGIGEKNTLSASIRVIDNAQGAIFEVLTTSADIKNGSTQGQHYSELINVQGGVPPFTFTLSSGALPAGLQLGSFGGIYGTPASGAAGVYAFVVEVRDSIGNMTNKTLSLTVVDSVVGDDQVQGPAAPGIEALPAGSGGGGCAMSNGKQNLLLALVLMLGLGGLLWRRRVAS